MTDLILALAGNKPPGKTQRIPSLRIKAGLVFRKKSFWTEQAGLVRETALRGAV